MNSQHSVFSNIPNYPKLSLGLWIGISVIFVFLGFSLFLWYGCRIEVESGRVAVLVHKTGEDLLGGKIIAERPEQKGIQLDVLSEGRYFRNPYHWDWLLNHILLDIPAGKFAVKVRLYGEDLPPNEIIAKEGTRGIVAEVLSPGKYRINPYAYEIRIFDAITIKPGFVGIVTSLVGKDIQNSQIPEKERNTFLVSEDKKGILPAVLDAGTYYLNPYRYNVVELSLQSHRFEMSGEDAISFLTEDGFTVHAEGTLEYSLKRDQVAFLAHRVGDLEDVRTKVILPRARGFSRIEGSKHPAVNFIIGETRQQFENHLKTHLKETCEPWGVNIISVLIRNIIPPNEIAEVIRAREIAVQDALKFEQQIVEAKSRAELIKQEKLAIQSREKVQAETNKMAATIQADKAMAVQLMEAQRELQVAKIENETAQFQVQAILSGATADQKVIQMENQARAEVITKEVQAFGNGTTWANYYFYQKLAPQIVSILTNDSAENLGGLFQHFLPLEQKKKTLQ
jgi:regulator of protease activity HflC (stomatin/prohibitin superfamily)